ncbi:hypothetical protein ABW19_dt0206641 [Dactylella cylindrospora]|nr:hypothetical protein ABW19_dt0206641 [Dactylella cylindrospora]
MNRVCGMVNLDIKLMKVKRGGQFTPEWYQLNDGDVLYIDYPPDKIPVHVLEKANPHSGVSRQVLALGLPQPIAAVPVKISSGIPISGTLQQISRIASPKPPTRPVEPALPTEKGPKNLKLSSNWSSAGSFVSVGTHISSGDLSSTQGEHRSTPNSSLPQKQYLKAEDKYTSLVPIQQPPTDIQSLFQDLSQLKMFENRVSPREHLPEKGKKNPQLDTENASSLPIDARRKYQEKQTELGSFGTNKPMANEHPSEQLLPHLGNEDIITKAQLDDIFGSRVGLQCAEPLVVALGLIHILQSPSPGPPIKMSDIYQAMTPKKSPALISLASSPPKSPPEAKKTSLSTPPIHPKGSARYLHELSPNSEMIVITFKYPNGDELPMLMHPQNDIDGISVILLAKLSEVGILATKEQLVVLTSNPNVELELKDKLGFIFPSGTKEATINIAVRREDGKLITYLGTQASSII